jgi:hypothetical protein
MAALGAIARALEVAGYDMSPPVKPMRNALKSVGIGVRRPAVTIGGVGISKPAVITLAAAGAAAAAFMAGSAYRRNRQEAVQGLFRSATIQSSEPNVVSSKAA